MANHPSAAKRNRQRIKRSARNKNLRSALRTTVKRARAAIEGGEADAKAKMHAAAVALARAASAGVIHANSAARGTARLSSALHKRTTSS